MHRESKAASSLEAAGAPFAKFRHSTAFGGYKHSGYGRETHRMIMDHYQQTKNLLVSYSPNAMGFF